MSIERSQAADGEASHDTSLAWLTTFRELHGRPPRILHIGNIANNAYLNAKLLNARGIDCDVLCYDYYHIMGCPEWEDADFEGEIEDQFRPDWSSLDLRGFERPRWFAQGPLLEAMRYLRARRRGDEETAKELWSRLNAGNASLAQQGGPQTFGQRLRRTKHRVRSWLGRARDVLRRVDARIRCRRFPYGFAWRRLVDIARGLASILFLPLVVPFVLLRAPVTIANRLRGNSGSSPPGRSEHLDSLLASFAEVFPERQDTLTRDDLTPFVAVLEEWRALFELYDGVIGYATDGMYPLLVGKRPYLAFEHGTIRNLPFEATPTGRLTALVYRLADTSLITNCDNIVAAGRLRLENHRFVPHPINEEHREDAPGLRDELRSRLDSDFIVFHPSRQHWEERRHPDWEKGNDVLIHGFARFVHEVNPRAAAIFVDWGQKVRESKALLQSLGVGERVLWIPPQANRRLIRYIRATDVLADQFYLGAFGSTMPKGLLHACPSMLYLDHSRHEWCFDEMPPVLNARTPNEVFEGLRRVHEDPAFREELVRRGVEWYERHHSNEVIARTLAKELGRVLVP